MGFVCKINLLGLLPLFILSKGGRNFKVLDEVLTRLQEANEHELLILTRLFAEATFTSAEERAQLYRRLAMLQDIESTPTYQRLTQKGREEGIKEGIEKMKQIVLDVIDARFPSLHRLVEKQLGPMRDVEILQRVTVFISTARTAREIREYLLTLP